jgi:hypothetical protein
MRSYSAVYTYKNYAVTLIHEAWWQSRQLVQTTKTGGSVFDTITRRLTPSLIRTPQSEILYPASWNETTILTLTSNK